MATFIKYLRINNIKSTEILPGKTEEEEALSNSFMKPTIPWYQNENKSLKKTIGLHCTIQGPIAMGAYCALEMWLVEIKICNKYKVITQLQRQCEIKMNTKYLTNIFMWFRC